MTCSAHSGKCASLRNIALVVVGVVLAATVAGCNTIRPMETTGSLGGARAMQAQADPRRSAEARAQHYRGPDAATRYAQALRGSGQRSRAVAVLEEASIANPRHAGVLGAYGRALADMGNYRQAFDVLARAHTPDQPDWRILSVQGAVLDQMGRHEEAQLYYCTALRMVPGEPSVLSNLGLSYALSKDLVRAELTLRRAVGQSRADPRVRQNLALVVGLQGRFSEAEAIARTRLPSDEAAVNVAYLQQMMAQQNGLKPLEAVTQPAMPSMRSARALGS